VTRTRLPFRAWYYFRTGYATYLTFIIASVNALVTIYYLAINSYEDLKVLFPSFSIWAIFIISTVTPLGVFIGWLHLKRSAAYTSEVDIAVEVNPYYYKLPPGYWREALAPVLLQILGLNLKIISKEPLTESEINDLKNLQKKLQILIDGGQLGNPRRSTP
jgi:hypothetical protein